MTDVSIVRTVPDAHLVKVVQEDDASVRWEGVMWTIPRVDEVIVIGSDAYHVRRVVYKLDGDDAGEVGIVGVPVPA